MGSAPHRQAPDDVDRLKLGQQLQHHIADQWGNAVVEAHLPKVDIEAGFLAAGEGEITVVNGFPRDETNELVPCACHAFSLPRRFRLEG